MRKLHSAHEFTKILSCIPTKLALVVPADLNMSKGKTAAQCAHAAVLCVQAAQCSKDSKTQQILESWLVNGQPKIVLKVNGYDDIKKLNEEARKMGVTYALVQDAGRTKLAPGTFTVLGVGPDLSERIDKLTGHLKLL